MSSFIQLVISGLETGSIYALAALGIIIIFRTSFTTNFAQGTIGMFNAYIAGKMFYRIFSPTMQEKYKFIEFLVEKRLATPLAFLFGVLTAFAMGILIDLAIMRYSKKVDAVGKQIITMGLILILLGMKSIFLGQTNQNFGRLIPQGSIRLLDVNVSYNTMLNLGIVIVIFIALFTILQKSKWGLGVRVTASNEMTAQLMGVPTKTITMVVWAIAAALSTAGALMLAPRTSINTHLMGDVQVNAFLALVFGGFQTFYGAVIGAYTIAVTSNLLRFYVSDTWGDPIIYFSILIFLLVRPHGLIGKKYVKKV